MGSKPACVRLRPVHCLLYAAPHISRKGSSNQETCEHLENRIKSVTCSSMPLPPTGPGTPCCSSCYSLPGMSSHPSPRCAQGSAQKADVSTCRAAGRLRRMLQLLRTTCCCPKTSEHSPLCIPACTARSAAAASGRGQACLLYPTSTRAPQVHYRVRGCQGQRQAWCGY